MTIALWLVIAAALVAAATDIRTRKIPNALVLALGVASLVAAAADGTVSVLVYLAALVVCVALGTIVHALRLLGGGDVKLLAFSAAALGIHDGLAFLLFVALCGGVAGVLYSLVRGTLPQTLGNVRSMLFSLATGTSAGTPVNGTQHLPYALAIFSGAVLLALSKTFVPELRLPV
jgi:prepilin peptidase CpaA